MDRRTWLVPTSAFTFHFSLAVNISHKAGGNHGLSRRPVTCCLKSRASIMGVRQASTISTLGIRDVHWAASAQGSLIVGEVAPMHASSWSENKEFDRKWKATGRSGQPFPKLVLY